MGKTRDLFAAVGYWLSAQFRPLDEATAREMRFIEDVEGHCRLCLLVEEDESKREALELMIGRTTEIKSLAEQYCRSIRRTMAARPSAVWQDNWEEFETRVLAEVTILEKLSSKIMRLRLLNPELSALHMGAETDVEPYFTTPRG